MNSNIGYLRNVKCHFGICVHWFIVSIIIEVVVCLKMEPDMFYITEVDVDDKTYSNIPNDRTNRKRKKRTPLKVTNVEKRILAKLVEREPVIWDTTNEFHTNNSVLLSAWSRIASEMPGRNVPQCKIIWRSLKDAIRYRQKKVVKNGESVEHYEYELEYNWEFSDCMSFIMQAPSKRPRRNTPMTMENTDSSELENSFVGSNAVEVECLNSSQLTTSSAIKSTNISSTVDANENPNDGDSASESNYCIPTNAKKKEQDPLAQSVISISNSIREFVRGTIDDRHEKSTMTFDYIWQNLDKLFQELPDEAVDELNVKFIQMAYERIPKGQ